MHGIGSKLIEIQVQLRFYHWQTKSFARHEAFGKTYEAMDGLIDEFVEVFMGKYGRVPAMPINPVNINEKNASQFIDETISFLIALSNGLDEDRDTDLLNIRDEMVALFNKLRYLLTLK